jgi:hypothetical protein
MAKARPVERLTWDLFDRFIGRKGALLMGVVTDTETKGLPLYPMPQGIEHMDYVPSLIGLDREGLIEDPSVAERFIPSIIEFEYDEEREIRVKKVLTGVSGIEIGLRVRHDRAALEAAHQRVLTFIDGGEIPKSDGFESMIQYEYAKKTESI